MKLLVILFFSMALSLTAMAQISPLFIEQTAKQADSLKIVAKQTNNDTIRMSALRDLTLYYLDASTDSALHYSELELPLAEKLDMKIWKADAYDLCSAVLNNKGDYPKSLLMINKALSIARDESCEKGIWHIEKFTNTGDPHKARLSMLATIQLDKGALYRSTQNFDKQMEVHLQCLKTASLINDYTVITIVQLNLGNLYRDKGQWDSAVNHYNESLVYSKKCGYRKYTSSVYNGLAEIYMHYQDFKKARQFLDSAFVISSQLNNQGELSSCYILIGQLMDKTGLPDSAVYYGRKGLAVSTNSAQVRSIAKAYSALADIYQSQKRYDSAYKYLKLSETFKDSVNGLDKIVRFQNIGFDTQLKLQELEKEKIETQSKIRTYAMLGGLLVILLVALILYRNNLQKRKTNNVLEKTLSNLKSTQAQLIQSEKMASLGELTAGIAHEIQNPLNFVNNFSEVSNELIDEMKQELATGNRQLATEIADDIKQNLEKINHHGQRAADIVKGMLQHSRTSTGQKEPTDINALCDEYLRLAYHGLRAKEKSFNAEMKTDFDNTLPKINVVPQDIGRVILNLINNAFYAVSAKALATADSNYIPTVTVKTSKNSPLLGRGVGGEVEISIKDNGSGIPSSIKDKIFQPFFTTKPTGQGTGLGLSLSYDIVKAHGGEIKVNSKEYEGTEFIIKLPVV